MKNINQQKVVCITGMHRSGTSMLARLLCECGLDLGRENDLYGPQPDNPEGYWENANFVDINNKIFAKLDCEWDVPKTFKPGWENDPQLDNIRDEARELILGFNSSTTWGWKDPRTSLTLDFWKALIPNLKIIKCLRNPLSVARSLNKRGYSSDLFGFNLWYAYNLSLKKSTTASNSIMTHYENFFIKPGKELNRILDWLEIKTSQETINKACSTIDLSLQHNKFSIDDLINTKAKRALIEFYSDLCIEAGPVFPDMNAEAKTQHEKTVNTKKNTQRIKRIVSYLQQFRGGSKK